MLHAVSASLILCFFALTMLPSCSSTNRLLKAKPAELSAFFEHPNLVTDSRKKLPFHKIWMTPDHELEALAVMKTRLFIAPVNLQYLRPVKKALVRNEISWGSIERREAEMAHKLRNEFAKAYLRSASPRYQIAQQPGPDTLTLEMAIVELNPTSPKGNAVKTAMKFVVGPLAGLGGIFTKGNMAIEGKVRDSKSGKLFFQFADNEADKMTFYSVRDFKPYGHAIPAMRKWAEQFELMTRTAVGQTIKDTYCITLMPY
ncbi:MAG: DUF3313 family protein [Prosthecobacter sp.]